MPNNIIFYFTDQQRWDTCGCFGQPLNITPNLDELAREGVKFDNAFSPQPVCGPCRALFQTGKWPTETGCFRNNLMLPAGVKTLGSYIEEAGYETAYIGKWHLASDGELEKPPVVDHTVTAIPRELRGVILATGGRRTCWSSPPTAMTASCSTRTTTGWTSRATGRTASPIWPCTSSTGTTGRSPSS